MSKRIKVLGHILVDDRKNIVLKVRSLEISISMDQMLHALDDAIEVIDNSVSCNVSNLEGKTCMKFSGHQGRHHFNHRNYRKQA